MWCLVRGENRNLPGGKPLIAELRTNKLNPFMTVSAEIEPRPHWWKASALTTRPNLPVKKNTKTFQGMLYLLDEFLFDNICICRFSRGTVLNVLKQRGINILRGKKDATTCSCVLFSS